MFNIKQREVHVIVREDLSAVWWQTLQRPKSKLLKLNREQLRLEVKVPGFTSWAGRTKGSVYTPPHIEIWQISKIEEGADGKLFVTLDSFINGWCTGRKDRGTGEHQK